MLLTKAQILKYTVRHCNVLHYVSLICAGAILELTKIKDKDKNIYSETKERDKDKDTEVKIIKMRERQDLLSAASALLRRDPEEGS